MRLFFPKAKGIFLLAICTPILAGAQVVFEEVTQNHGFLITQNSDVSGTGVAVGDFDNDGDPDVFVCGAKDNPDRLYRNDNGVYVEMGASVGLNSAESSRMALWMDIDGDGDMDLLVSGDCDGNITDCPDAHHLRLYEQQNGIFINISEAAGLYPYGAKKRTQTLGGMAAGDLNNDGYLDFVLAVRNGRLQVFINQRDKTFKEMSAEFGFRQKDHKFYQMMLHDFNHDGLLDIYCNVDFEDNQFWMQEKATGLFEERAFRTWSNNSANEMGMTVGDFDQDGDLDIYSTNIANYLGKDVHNILLRNDYVSDANFRFTEVSKTYGVDKAGWGWGAIFFDADNNGLLDLATTNGFNLGFETIDASKMWMQFTLGTFEDVSASVQFNDILNGHALVSLDFDGDGDLDMIQTIKGFTTPRTTLRLLENKIGEQDRGNYLVVKPRMQVPNTSAIGAVVTAFVEGVPHMRLIHAGTSMYGQEMPDAFIGVANATVVDSLSIRWPGGEVSWWYDLETNQTIVLTDDDVVHRPGSLKVMQLGLSTWLTWNDYPVNEDGFLVLRATNESFTDAVEISLDPNSTGYLDQDVDPNVTYFYKIRAYNGWYVSQFTHFVRITLRVLGIKESFPSFTLFPNPSSSQTGFTLLCEEPITLVEIYDASGKQLRSLKDNVTLVSAKEVHIRGLIPGVYVVVVNGSTSKLQVR